MKKDKNIRDVIFEIIAYFVIFTTMLLFPALITFGVIKIIKMIFPFVIITMATITETFVVSMIIFITILIMASFKKK
nr:MAG TPA: apocytochrome F [Caudoviricetes sp.]